MLPYCKMTSQEAVANVSNTWINGHCYGIIYGMTQMLRLFVAQHPDPLVCMAIPEAVTNEQLVNVIDKFAEAHSEIVQLPFTTLALMAMRTTWPCKK